MTEAFCPGHVSCIFSPYRDADIMRTGSSGVGLKLGLGAHAKVSFAEKTEIYLDGKLSEAPVTARAAELVDPGGNFRIEIRSDLPVSQGFAMSAAGSIAAALCVSELAGKSREEAYAAAHRAEAECGGGLGDAVAIAYGSRVPVRTAPGMPPFGKVEDSGIRMEKIVLAVLGPKMPTGKVLSDDAAVSAICREAASAMEDFLGDPSAENLFICSNAFSRRSRLRGKQVSDAVWKLAAHGYNAGMCMLGNSIFTDAPAREVSGLFPDAEVFSCPLTDKKPEIIRKG